MIHRKGLIVMMLVASVWLCMASGCSQFGDMISNIQNNIPQQGPGESEMPEVPEADPVVAKLDESKGWIYDADYELPTKKDRYYGYLDHSKLIAASDLVVPYINIDSTDAKKANDAIYKIYETLIETFNDNLQDEIWFTVVDYQPYIHDDMVSVIIIRESGGTYVPLMEYDAYNFHLSDGSAVSYEEAYTAAGFDESTIQDAASKAIANALQEEYGDDYDFNTYKKQSIKNYQKSVDKKKIRFFFDQSNTLHIIVTLSVPAGTGTEDAMIAIK